MKKTPTILTMILLFCSLLLHAQQSITGLIMDSNGTPIPGATIIISGTSQGATSDFDGNFTISADGQASLEFSSIGFESQTIAINGQDNLTIILEVETARNNNKG